MQAKKFSIIDSIKFGFAKTIEHFGMLFLAQFIRWIIWFAGYMFLVVFVSGGIMPFRMMMYERGIYQITHSFSIALISLLIVGILVIEIIDSALSLGLMQMMFDIYDKGRTNFSVIFSKWHLVVKNVLLIIVLRAILTLGIILLIIPGIFLAIRFGFAYQILVDKEVGPIEALKLSYKLTEGSWVHLFGLWLIFLFINFVGACCFLFGLLITIPTSFLAYVYAYRKLGNRKAHA